MKLFIKEKLHQSCRSVRYFKLSLWRIYLLRIAYFLFRYFRPIRVPEGFTLTTPNELISYWYFFVQHEFDDPTWTAPFKQASAALCIDIGANFGVFSRYLLHLNSRARIIMFEPMEEAHSVLKTVPNTSLLPVALGAEVAFTGKFEMSKGNFKQLAQSEDGKPLMVDRLDSYQLSPFLVKIDVEGMELDVVRGGLKTLRQTPYILIESSEENLDTLDALLPAHHCMRLTIVDWLYYL